MDGVLLDTENFHYLAWKKAFKLKDIDLSKNDYTKYCQAQGRVNAINNMIKQPTPNDYSLIANAKARAYKEAIDSNTVVLYEDARLLLDYLKKQQQIKLAIASSSVVADYVIKKTQVASQFSHYITGAMINRNKPYPDIFNLAAKEINIDKGHLVVIEDSIAGVIAGRLAGINVFAINRHHSLDRFNPTELTSIIKDLELNLTINERSALNHSKTIPIESLTQVIPYL